MLSSANNASVSPVFTLGVLRDTFAPPLSCTGGGGGAVHGAIDGRSTDGAKADVAAGF